MIEFEHVSFSYDGADRPVLRDVNLALPEGDLCLVVGRTGSGKSTLLGAINGLVPHFTGGTLTGRVAVAGRDTAQFPPRELADVVGVVGQDPLAGFVTDTVEEELAYGMEQLAVPPATMRKRVEETLDLLGLSDLRGHPLRDLSGGQQQRVAIGSVLTSHPQVLVLDEPTSALDPTAAEEVLAAVTRLVHDLGVTVVMAEHRLERVTQYADRVITVGDDGAVTDGSPAVALRSSSIAPPVVNLGRLARWDPLPLSVRDARRRAEQLRSQLPATPPKRTPRIEASGESGNVLEAKAITVRYGQTVAVREVSLQLAAGEICFLMGRNGSGKSSLLWALQGSGPRHTGSVTSLGRVGLVPQTPTDLLYLSRVRAELTRADEAAAGSDSAGPDAAELLARMGLGVKLEAHPRDLSEGQKLGLVLALQLRAAPRVLLLDEPTRGLDYPAKEALSAIVRDLASDGHAVLISTHDVEFAAGLADRVMVLAEGEIVAHGPAEEVLAASPAFAPQVAKVLAPLPYLTVDQVARALVA